MTNTPQESRKTRHIGVNVLQLCDVLKILANPNRMRILLHLLDGEIAVGEIESSLQIKQPNLSHELKKLRDADLVTTKRQSKVVFYQLKNNTVKTLLISVCSAMNESSAFDDYALANMPKTSDSKSGVECGLFANVQLQETV